MSAFADALRSGSWITRERMRLWGFAALIASLAGLGFLLAGADGLNDYQGRPLGTDFSRVYAAGTYALEGRAEAAFDWSALHERQRAIFGAATPFYVWHDPPLNLLVAAPLALMPYAVSLAVWQATTLLLYLAALWAILRAVAWQASAAPNLLTRDRTWLLIALAFPAVLINVGHGHDGFLIAAILGAALVVLDRRPAVAGLLLGLLAFKPLLAVLVWTALIAAGRWRAIAAAAATAAALALAALVLFGVEAWSAFFVTAASTKRELVEQGGLGWYKLLSVFAVVRMWGGGLAAAYALQAALAAAIVAALAWLWRGPTPTPRKAAALAIGALAAAPYGVDFDLVILAPAIAFLTAQGFARGFLPWEKTALAVLWFMPLVARTAAEQALLPLGVPAMLAVFALMLWSAVTDPDRSVRPATGASFGRARAETK